MKVFNKSEIVYVIVSIHLFVLLFVLFYSKFFINIHGYFLHEIVNAARNETISRYTLKTLAIGLDLFNVFVVSLISTFPALWFASKHKYIRLNRCSLLISLVAILIAYFTDYWNLFLSQYINVYWGLFLSFTLIYLSSLTNFKILNFFYKQSEALCPNQS